MAGTKTRLPWHCLLLGAVVAASLAGARQSDSSDSFREPKYKGPLGLIVDETGKSAIIALHTAGTVAFVDFVAGKCVAELPVDAEPAEVTLSGGLLYLRSEDSDSVTVIDPERRVVVRRLPLQKADRQVVDRLTLRGAEAARLLPAGATNIRGSAEAGGGRLFVYQRARSQVPATQVSQGWVFTNALTFDAGLFGGRTTLSLDEPQRGYADPSDVAVSPDGGRIFVACSGADTVLVLDRHRLRKLFASRPPVYGPQHDAGADLTASHQVVIARLTTQANPRRLALSGDGKTLVVTNHLADSLSIFDATALTLRRHIALGGPAPDAARRGEVLFHSNRLTFQGQFTCASCHPAGGADGLNWDLERDGVGSFKNTKALWGIRDTAPYGWHGSSPTLADRIRGTLQTLHRHEPAEDSVSDLVAYLASLPPPSPQPVASGKKDAVARGKVLFEGKALCSNCHYRQGLDDGLAHDIGTRGPTDTQDKFDTPGLRGVARTAPYLHDGRAAALEEVFTKHNARQRHGAAHLLSSNELAELLEFLSSL